MRYSAKPGNPSKSSIRQIKLYSVAVTAGQHPSTVTVVGCGVVGAAIAYELSQGTGLSITVLDQAEPAQGATQASLGVLMAVVSTKAKGRNLRWRLASLQRYEEWIPSLEAITGESILYNRQGILRLCFEGEDLGFWRSLAEIRAKQGWRLELGDRPHIATTYPQINLDRVIGAVYSPQDRQLDPAALTRSLVKAAEQNGVQFHFHTAVTDITPLNPGFQIHTSGGVFETDWLAISAGTGSTPLTAMLKQPVDIRPVLGQAMQVALEQPLGNPQHQPMITGEDTHIVPLGNGNYWVGATVEIAAGHADAAAIQPNPAALQEVWQRAIALCPDLATATIRRTWSGLRPRPEGRPAPIIERIPGYDTAILASGHYRNGILLAPATAQMVRDLILG